MLINFTKMHGLGNDFVVIDATQHAIDLSEQQIRFIADRRFGVGCDQLLLVEPADNSDVDFCYRIYNADGGEVEQCGNGARCFARFVRDQGLTDKKVIPVSTNTGRIVLQILDDEQVRVDMGVPHLQPDNIPFISDQQEVIYTLEFDDAIENKIEIGTVSLGNPHAVLLIDDVDTAPVESLGPKIEQHPRFPNRVNAGFMQVIDRNTIRLRVFERGVGETQACGTGACAAVVSGILRGLLDNNVRVILSGGELDIQWKGTGTPVFMTGPAETVFTGSMTL